MNETSTVTETSTGVGTGDRRPVSIPHLVFAVVFLGIATVRFVGEATDSDLPGSAIGFPIVLIGAGIVGLVATVVTARRRTQAAFDASYAAQRAEARAAAATEETEADAGAGVADESDVETTTVLKEDDR